MRKILLAMACLTLLLVPLFQASAQSGNLVLVVGPAPITTSPPGPQFIPSGGGMLFCSTVLVDEIGPDGAKLSGQGGWIPASSIVDIMDDLPLSQRLAICLAHI